MKKYYRFFLLFLFLTSFFSFDTKAQVSKKAIDDFLNDSAVNTGHAGISIFNPATGKYLYNYNAEKNFLPSSNTKLFTLYAGLKYLGDSIVGIRYKENDTAIFIIPTGDPTLLHSDFLQQPVIQYLSSTQKRIYIGLPFKTVASYSQGWAWDDYSEEFMPERSVMPLYGNIIRFSGTEGHINFSPRIFPASSIYFPYFEDVSDSLRYIKEGKRDMNTNMFFFKKGNSQNKTIGVPFIVSDSLIKRIFSDTIHKKIEAIYHTRENYFAQLKILHSRPVDSLFRPMMFNSDNFFAEQTLLMVSNEKLGYMSDEDIIDTLLENDFKDIPTKPRWVDGSGLSRYNLFSPKDFIYILVKLKNEFGWERIKRILPAGGEGTLANYYENDPESIHAKTGSMSNNVSLSGYITTKKGKDLIFSVIINNFTGTGKSGRKAIERLIQSVIQTN